MAKSLYAGLMIGIGGTVYLACDNKYIGAFLFAIGLWTILSLGLYLFTGKVCLATDNKPLYSLWLVPVWIFNFIGAALMGILIRYTRIAPNLIEKAETLAQAKLTDDPISILILSVFCGMMMYIAVWMYSTSEPGTIRQFAAAFIPIAVFILAGFEHCIANIYYISLAGAWDTRALLYVLLMTLGNTLGGIVGPIFYKLSNVGKKIHEPEDVPTSIRLIHIDEDMTDEEIDAEFKKASEELRKYRESHKDREDQ